MSSAQPSGGQAQRVALAQARQPALLFADEPFSALDVITRAECKRCLVRLVHRWNTAMLLVSGYREVQTPTGYRVLK